MKKILEVLKSQNAFVSYVSIFLLALSTNGILVQGTPEEIINLFTGKQAGEIIAVLVLNFFTPLYKLAQKIIAKQWDWTFLKSENFLTQVLSIVTLVAGALLGQELAGVAVALGMQVINFVKHLIRPAKDGTV